MRFIFRVSADKGTMENFQNYRSPGWYPDPNGDSMVEKWWNGNEWAETREITNSQELAYPPNMTAEEITSQVLNSFPTPNETQPQEAQVPLALTEFAKAMQKQGINKIKRTVILFELVFGLIFFVFLITFLVN